MNYFSERWAEGTLKVAPCNQDLQVFAIINIFKNSTSSCKLFQNSPSAKLEGFKNIYLYSTRVLKMDMK